MPRPMATAGAIILSILLTIISLWVLYRIIRVAVCHGIEDARRRAAQQAREGTGLDPARPS